MRRFALLLLLCGCHAIPEEDRELLTACQRNAPTYFEGGKLSQALAQAERGLEIDPDDYKLQAIRGATLLRLSEQNPKLLAEATRQLETVYERRSPMRHEAYVLLYYALAQQKQGLRSRGESIRLDDRARRNPGQKEALQAQAEAERQRSDERLREADEVLGYLLDLGSQLRLSYKHRLQIALQLGDDEGFDQSVKAYLKEAEREQADVRREVERTQTADYEAEQYKLLRSLRSEEIEVRELYGNWLFRRGQLEGALSQLNRMLELDPQRSNDYYNRGRVLKRLGREDAAKRDFRMFLSMSRLPDDNDKKTFAVNALKQ